MNKTVARLLTLFFTLCLTLLPLELAGQNIQLHYDFGRHVYPEALKGRPYIMTTVEQQSVDKYGDTFYFIDMNFLSQGGVAANWKFLRNLRFWRAPFSWHVRYDGGLRFRDANRSNEAITLNDSYFTGVTYHWRSADRKLILNTTVNYKYIKKHSRPHNWEAVIIWGYRPGNGLFSATGFAEVWREKDARFGTTHKFMSQPQFWFNLEKLQGIPKDVRLSLGSEIRISNNLDQKGWSVIPTLAMKWSFGKS